MARVLVFSDSHGKTDKMFKIINNIEKVDYIIHLGDIHKDVISLEDEFPNIKIYFVKGNNDYYFDYPTEKLIEIESVKIFITHGHNYSDDKRLWQRAENADLILYGHTHISCYKAYENKIIANPGSISMPRHGCSSYGVLEIENGKLKYDNIEIN